MASTKWPWWVCRTTSTGRSSSPSSWVATEDAIVKACKKELASYKVPKRIEIMGELPRNATGKILKRELIKATPDD